MLMFLRLDTVGAGVGMVRRLGVMTEVAFVRHGERGFPTGDADRGPFTSDAVERASFPGDALVFAVFPLGATSTGVAADETLSGETTLLARLAGGKSEAAKGPSKSHTCRLSGLRGSLGVVDVLLLDGEFSGAKFGLAVRAGIGIDGDVAGGMSSCLLGRDNAFSGVKFGFARRGVFGDACMAEEMRVGLSSRGVIVEKASGSVSTSLEVLAETGLALASGGVLRTVLIGRGVVFPALSCALTDEVFVRDRTLFVVEGPASAIALPPNTSSCTCTSL